VPETSRTAADLVPSLVWLAGHDPPVAVKLIYQMFAKLLSCMVLHARSDTVLVPRTVSPALTSILPRASPQGHVPNQPSMIARRGP
jgi:hypothetical protein